MSGTVLVSGRCQGSESVFIGYDLNPNYVKIDCLEGRFEQQVSFPVVDGGLSITARQKDPGGQEVISISEVTKDTLSPVLKETSIGSGNKSTNRLAQGQIQCESNLPLIIEGDVLGSPISANCSDGAFSYSVPLSGEDGSKTVQFIQTDDAGNSNSLSLTYFKDTTPPSLIVQSPTAGTEFSNQVTVRGQCEVDSTIEITGSEITNAPTLSCTTGQFQAAISFSQNYGNVTVTIQATDKAGNSTQLPLNLVHKKGLIDVAVTTDDFKNLSDKSGTLQLTFSKSVTGLEISDFLTDNISITHLSGENATYTVSLVVPEEGPYLLYLPKGAVTSNDGGQNQSKDLLVGQYYPVRNSFSVEWDLVDREKTYSITMSENDSPLKYKLKANNISGTDRTIGRITSECFGGDPNTMTAFGFGDTLTTINRTGASIDRKLNPMPQLLRPPNGEVGTFVVQLPAGSQTTEVSITPQSMPGYHNGIQCVLTHYYGVDDAQLIAFRSFSFKVFLKSTRTPPKATLILDKTTVKENETLQAKVQLSAPYLLSELVTIGLFSGTYPKRVFPVVNFEPGVTEASFTIPIPDDGLYNSSLNSYDLKEYGNTTPSAFSPINVNIENISPLPEVSFTVTSLTLSEHNPIDLIRYLRFKNGSHIPLEFSWELADGTAKKGNCTKAGQDYLALNSFALSVSYKDSSSNSGSSTGENGGGSSPSTEQSSPRILNSFDQLKDFRLEACGDFLINAANRKFQVKLKDFKNAAPGSQTTIDILLADDDTQQLKVQRLNGTGSKTTYGELDISNDDATIYALDNKVKKVLKYSLKSERIDYHTSLEASYVSNLSRMDLNGNDLFITGAQSLVDPTIVGFEGFNTSSTNWSPYTQIYREEMYRPGEIQSQGSLLLQMQEGYKPVGASSDFVRPNGRLTVYKKANGNWTKEFEVTNPGGGSYDHYAPQAVTNGSSVAVAYEIDNTQPFRIYEKKNGVWAVTTAFTYESPTHVKYKFSNPQISNDHLIVKAEGNYGDPIKFFWFQRVGSEWINKGDLSGISPQPTEITSLPTVFIHLRGDKLTFNWTQFGDKIQTTVHKWNGTEWVFEDRVHFPEEIINEPIFDNIFFRYKPAIPLSGRRLLYYGGWIVKY